MLKGWGLLWGLGGCLLGPGIAAASYTVDALPTVEWGPEHVVVNGFWMKQGIAVELIENDFSPEVLWVALQQELALALLPTPLPLQIKSATGHAPRTIAAPPELFLVKLRGLTAMPPADLPQILRSCLAALRWMRAPSNWQGFQAIQPQSLPEVEVFQEFGP
jgi:hypothetical protein